MMRQWKLFLRILWLMFVSLVRCWKSRLCPNTYGLFDINIPLKCKFHRRSFRFSKPKKIKVKSQQNHLLPLRADREKAICSENTHRVRYFFFLSLSLFDYFKVNNKLLSIDKETCGSLNKFLVHWAKLQLISQKNFQRRKRKKNRNWKLKLNTKSFLLR